MEVKHSQEREKLSKFILKVFTLVEKVALIIEKKAVLTDSRRYLEMFNGKQMEDS